MWRRERFGLSDGLAHRTQALQALNEIGIALSAERNPRRTRTRLVTGTRHLVAADAGSLYLIEKDAQGKTYLRFTLAQNDSVVAPWQESLLPLTQGSVAGTVAQNNTVVVIDDAYALPMDGPLRHNHSFDARFGYHTRSIVGIPLSTRDGEVLGVLQLINRKPHSRVCRSPIPRSPQRSWGLAQQTLNSYALWPHRPPSASKTAISMRIFNACLKALCRPP